MQQFSTWKRKIKILLWVSVVLIIQHAKRMRRILFYSLYYRNVH